MKNHLTELISPDGEGMRGMPEPLRQHSKRSKHVNADCHLPLKAIVNSQCQSKEVTRDKIKSQDKLPFTGSQCSQTWV